jgi:hypothetical protein
LSGFIFKEILLAVKNWRVIVGGRQDQQPTNSQMHGLGPGVYKKFITNPRVLG